jgi:hypothetical protein
MAPTDRPTRAGGGGSEALLGQARAVLRGANRLRATARGAESPLTERMADDVCRAIERVVVHLHEQERAARRDPPRRAPGPGPGR